MRKTQTPGSNIIDGHIAAPNGERDFMEWNWDDELKNHIGNVFA